MKEEEIKFSASKAERTLYRYIILGSIEVWYEWKLPDLSFQIWKLQAPWLEPEVDLVGRFRRWGSEFPDYKVADRIAQVDKDSDTHAQKTSETMCHQQNSFVGIALNRQDTEDFKSFQWTRISK